MVNFFENAVRQLVESLRFYTSPIDPKTRKGGGYSRKEAVRMAKEETMLGQKGFDEAFRRLGWKK